ncbi:MAG: SUMF1/EgtB/PvdO family nonheme iron enzyme [Anaerolineae bacterium]
MNPLLPNVDALLPPPFAWCEVQSSQPVTLTVGEWQNFQYQVKETIEVNGPYHFWMSKYLITNAQYLVFLDAEDGYANEAWWARQNHPLALESRLANAQPVEMARDNDRPATWASFYDAKAFCAWLHHRLNLPPTLEIRLPAEQEWQKAAQGDDQRRYPWGDEFATTRANTRDGNIVKTTPVTQFPDGASPFGVFDMSGNVWEWCDSFVETGAVLRGGSWRFDARFATTTYRYFYEPDQGHGNIGFRIIVQAKSA